MQKSHFVFILAVPLLAGLALTATAKTYHLSADGSGELPNIQSALDVAGNGDVILLENGRYTGPGNRDIRFHGKAVTLASASGDPESCIIDCESSGAEPHRGFLFDSGEGPGSVLRGICITGGGTSGSWPEDAGGGIYCRNQSSPSIENCILRENRSGNGAGICCDGDSSPALFSCHIQDNNASFYGGGLYCHDGSAPFIQDCRISGNRAGYYGGGLRSANSSPQILESTFCNNEAVYGGAGMAFSGETPASVIRCTITKNRSSGDGGGIYCYYAAPSIENTLIAENEAEGIFTYGSSTPSLVRCDIYGNEGGDWQGSISDQLDRFSNISMDPQFCLDQIDNSFLLQSDSPCAAGAGTGEAIGAWGVGCQDFTAEEITWSRLKNLH
jgi:hypothetical protein